LASPKLFAGVAQAESISRQELAIHNKHPRSDELGLARNLKNLGAVSAQSVSFWAIMMRLRRFTDALCPYSKKALGANTPRRLAPGTGSRSFIPLTDNTARRRNFLPK
jgi:hypothetical protein